MGTGTMTAPPQVVGLPWYHRDDYPALLSVFSDPDKLPNTFDAWLEHAEKLRGSTTPDSRPLADLKMRLFPDSPYAKEHSPETPTKPAKN